CGGIRGERG
nr:Chain A, HISTONE H3 PEPTIDE [synthetic construct]